jgi:site-specific DNA-cytosine methylase
MKILELFAGSRSFGSIAESEGNKVFSVDWKPFPGISLQTDIGTLKVSDIPFIPDIIWASPDCATYSIAAIGHHRNGVLPKTDYAKFCDDVNTKVVSLINSFCIINPDCKFFIENPRGMLRKMPFMKGIDRATVWYCQYGDFRAKPTDIFSNHIKNLYNPKGWQPRPPCYNERRTCHHERSPRHVKNAGTNSLKNSFERSKIPADLCREILHSCIIL